MKYYSALIRQRVKSGPSTLGIQLARLAISREISVQEIAQLLGASRVTVYNWFAGKRITNAYVPRVKLLVQILKTARDNTAAWEQACQLMHTVQ